MRMSNALVLCVVVCLPILGCPPVSEPNIDSRDIGPGGGVVRAGDGVLTIPPGGMFNNSKITVERNKSGVTVATAESETPVSDIFSITQDAGIIQAKGSARFTFAIPYNAGAVTAKANTNAHVYALVNTPDGVIRMFGTLANGSLELSLGGLLDSGDFLVVHNPNMVVAPGDIPTAVRSKLTNPPPWQSGNWLIAYDPTNSTIRAVAAQLSGKPIAAVTTSDVEIHVRNPIAAAAHAAAQYYIDHGYRQPNLGVKTIAGTGTGFVIDVLASGGSHYRRGILGSYGELQIRASRLTDSPSGVLGSIVQTITHEMFHGIVDGYELEGYPNGNASSFRGHDEGLAQLLGHTRDNGTIAVRQGETMLLDQRLGIDTDNDAYRSGDFYAYVAKRFGGGSLTYIGGTGNGLLEQVRLWVEDRDPSTAAASYPVYLQGISNSFGGQFALSLSEVYWDFARNRAYEHNDESRLRPGDSMARYSLARNRFTSAGILTRTIADAAASIVVTVPNMPTMSSVAVELIADNIESDLTITLDTAGLTPDSIGNSVLAKAYLEGMDGVEMSPASPVAMLSGFGVDGVTRAYIVVSNVSDEKVFAPAFTIAATPSDGSTGGITGRAVDAETSDPVAGVTVTAFASEGGPLDHSETTDSNGQFTIAGLPAVRVTLVFSSEGYLSTQQTVDVLANTTTQIDVSLVVRETEEEVGNASGRIIDAVTGDPVPGVLLDVRPGMIPPDSTGVPVIGQATADASGVYLLEDYGAGTYTAFLSADGYESGILTIFVVGGESNSGQDGELVPELAEEEIRIILTWGAEPRDLDSHLTAPTPDGGRFHLYYSSRGRHAYLDLYDLDLDDIGSFGPETITLYRLIPGTYRYSVHDFSNRFAEGSSALSNSGAQVRVFTEDGVHTFNVSPGREGTVWTVFEIDGDTGHVTPVNDYFYESSPSNSGSFKVIGAEVPQIFVGPEK